MNQLLKQDLKNIVKKSHLFVPLEGKTILITGATGLIGSLLIKSILVYNKTSQNKISIVGLARNRSKVNDIFQDFIYNSPELTIYLQDIINKIQIEQNIDFIVHTASNTSSKSFVEQPVETIMTAIQGCSNMLELGRSKNIKSFVYLSSLEVYGIPYVDNEISRISENKFGYLDPCLIRNCYPEGKRLAECLCMSYCAEYKIPVKIARLAQTFGPGGQYNDPRVFAEFARNAIEGKNIMLHTKGKTVRNYCYTMDAISAILLILTKGVDGEAYNVANKNTTTSIYHMAEIVKLLSVNPIEILYDIDKCNRGYYPEIKVELLTGKLEQLGWSAEIDLKDMFLRLIRCMESDTTKNSL